MDEMNNRQMVLLTMLTSFIVSIGTGIVTVAMLEEAPPTLTQTVNRVVERTIERVVTGSTTPEKKALPPVTTTVTKEVTIYAKEDDLVISAVEKNQPRIATIFTLTQETGTLPIASGFVVSRDGVIATDMKKISTEMGLREGYRIELNGKSYTARPMKSDAMGKSSVALLKISDTTESDIFDAVSFGRQVDPKIAQTVIIIGGGDGSGVGRGTLTKFNYLNPTATTTPKIIGTISTANKISADNTGALVVNLDGQAIGIVVTADDWTNHLIFPASRILDLITAVSAEGGTTSAAGESSKVGVNTP